MPHDEIMTSREVADYLKLNARTVTQLAASGRLPAMKLGGRWRFKRSFLEKWLEQGLVEGFAHEVGLIETHEASADCTVASLIPDNGIVLPLEPGDAQDVVSQLVNVGVEHQFVTNAPILVDAIMEREETFSTALPSGVALPHPRFRMARVLRQPFIAVGVSPAGIEYGAPDGSLTHIFFLMCLRTDALHLRALARISHMARSDAFIERLKTCDESDTIRQCIIDEEQQIFGN